MELDGTIFWYVAGALVAFALVISFVGIKGKASFPPSGGVMWGVTGLCAVLVAGACAYGVANAAEEKEHREHEIAEEEAEAEEQVAAAEQEAPTDVAPDDLEGGQPPGAELQGENESPAGEPAETFDITSPEDGSLVFDPDGLQADTAGTITLTYANPSPVPHNIAIEDESATVLAESETVMDGEVSVEAELVPGEYIYFCSVPGHREGGMEGTLTVDSDSATAD